MSEKMNFSIDDDLFCGDGGVSGQITGALKRASSYPDDFLRFAKSVLAGSTPSDSAPRLEELIVSGRLRYNLSADFGCVKLFVAKGAEAKYQAGAMTFEREQLTIGGALRIEWQTKQNDFNSDELCVYISPAEV